MGARRTGGCWSRSTRPRSWRGFSRNDRIEGRSVRPDLDALSPDRRPSQRRDDAAGEMLRHFDERITGVHADLANLARGDPGFTGDRADEIAGRHAAMAAGPHAQHDHRASFVVRGLEPFLGSLRLRAELRSVAI